MLSQGDTLNMHGVHWHGNVVDDAGRHTDSVRMLSSTTHSVNLIADNPGTWLFHCHVSMLVRLNLAMTSPEDAALTTHVAVVLPFAQHEVGLQSGHGLLDRTSLQLWVLLTT